MSQKVIINVGVSGTGKTTWSTEYIKKNPGTFRINRDDIRKMLKGTLVGYYQQPGLGKMEDLVTEIEQLLFVNIVSQKHSVIIDNTNLKIGVINEWVELVEGYNETIEGDKCDLCFSLFSEANPEELKRRVMSRDGLNSEQVQYIEKQHSGLRTALEYVRKNFENEIIYESISNTNPENSISK